MWREGFCLEHPCVLTLSQNGHKDATILKTNFRVCFNVQQLHIMWGDQPPPIKQENKIVNNTPLRSVRLYNFVVLFFPTHPPDYFSRLLVCGLVNGHKRMHRFAKSANQFAVTANKPHLVPLQTNSKTGGRGIFKKFVKHF